jgi:2-iminobutanoate/2-iminopropanoate deaminase
MKALAILALLTVAIPAAAQEPPFSPAVRAGDLLFLSSEIGRPPGASKLVPGGIGPETEQVLRNIEATLKANGASLKDVVKCTVFLADMAEWPAMNAVYVRFFSKPYPARSALGASGLAMGARVEIECIARMPER